MDQIKIVFDRDLTALEFSVILNGHTVRYVTEANTLVIGSDQVLYGINDLTLDLLSDIKFKVFEIKEFWLNDSLSRQSLYLSYSDCNGTKFNNTYFKKDHPKIHIPFGNPMSWWIIHCNKKFNFGEFGKNLYDDYLIYYPRSIDIDPIFPPSQRDWFKFNFDFTVAPKTDLTNLEQSRSIPYFELDLSYETDKLYDEFVNSRPYLESSKLTKPLQSEYNQLEYARNVWDVFGIIMPESHTGRSYWKDNFVLDREKFPELYSLLERIEHMGIEISYAFVSETSGKSYVGPHVHQDLGLNYSVYQITIPLGWTSDSLFKLDGVGLIPTDRCVVFNDYNFFHGTVNPTEKTRYVLGINCDFTKYFS